jgi:hypothetical protein
MAASIQTQLSQADSLKSNEDIKYSGMSTQSTANEPVRSIKCESEAETT